MPKCSYCNEEVKPWTDKHGDLFTNICKECYKMPKTSKHTPIPWTMAEAPFKEETEDNIIRGIRIFSISDAEIAPANAYGDNIEEAKANAAFIVQACNSHDALVQVAEFASELKCAHEVGNGDNKLPHGCLHCLAVGTLKLAHEK